MIRVEFCTFSERSSLPPDTTTVFLTTFLVVVPDFPDFPDVYRVQIHKKQQLLTLYYTTLTKNENNVEKNKKLASSNCPFPKTVFTVKGIQTLKIGFVNRFISVISVVLGENTLAISFSTGEPDSMESEMVRVISLNTTGISEITRLKIRPSGQDT